VNDRGGIFAQLLAPVAPETFVAEHWERSPLFVRGEPQRVARWAFDREAFFTLVASQPWLAERVKAQFYDADDIHREQAIDPRLARTMFDAGMTVCGANLDAVDARWRELAADTREALGHAAPVFVNAYVSPPGKGFGLHFDTQSVFIVQLEGHKRWRYSRAPAMPNPPANVLADAPSLARFRREHPWAEITVPDEESLDEHLLGPGDVLYLPAGTWHRARAEGHSLALTLAVTPFSARDLVRDVVDRALVREREWREYLPLVQAASLPTEGVPRSIEELFARRLDELRARLAELTPAELAIQWRTELASVAGHRDVDADGRPRPQRGAIEITPEDLLRVAKPSGMIENARTETIALFAGSAMLELPADNRAFLRHIVAREQFVAREATRFSDDGDEIEWNDVREALGLLVELGALSKDGRPPVPKW
jgi:ribosomal protein L16 Arg81 hydroxylase